MAQNWLRNKEDRLIKRAMRILEQRMRYGDQLTSPTDVRQYLAMRFAGLEREVFVVLYLDTRNRLIKCDELFWGTIDGAQVHAREVVKAALAHNATAVIFAHNHPSGEPEPSTMDKALTQKLSAALDLVDIKVFDHLIVGGAKTISFSERGLLSP